MKKICIYIILLSSIYVGCFHNILGGFASAHANHENSHKQMNEHHHSSMHAWEAEMECGEKTHECCISPYSHASFQISSQTIQKTIENDDSSPDIDDLSFIYEDLLMNCMERLNSPPANSYGDSQYTYSKSQYQHLIWVIRNNA